MKAAKRRKAHGERQGKTGAEKLKAESSRLKKEEEDSSIVSKDNNIDGFHWFALTKPDKRCERDEPDKGGMR